MLNPLLFKPKAGLLQFETGTACNANCLFCTHKNMKRHGTADWKTLQNVMYWHTHLVNEVAPFGMQEPTLEPRMPGILSQLKQFNPAVSTLLYSNMGVYDEEWWTKILKWQVLDTLPISFYGMSKQLYELIQPPLKFEETERNIKRLLKLKHRLCVEKPEINLHVLLTPETVGKAKSFYERWDGVVSNVGFVRWDSWCGEKPYSDEWETRYWGKSETERAPCPRLWRVMTVHYDGSVVPCCLDYEDKEPCGNINSDPQAWYKNKRLEEIRTMHLRGQQDEISLCKGCTVWRRDHDKVWNEMWKNENNEKLKVASCAVNPSTK